MATAVPCPARPPWCSVLQKRYERCGAHRPHGSATAAARRGKVRQALAEASRQVVPQKSLRNTAIRDIAKRARVEPSALHDHFASQNALREAFRAAKDLALARMFLLGPVNWTSEWLDPAKKSPDALAGVLYGLMFDGMVASQSPA